MIEYAELNELDIIFIFFFLIMFSKIQTKRIFNVYFRVMYSNHTDDII